MDAGWVVAAASATTAALAVFGFWMRFSDRVAKAETVADAAREAIDNVDESIKALERELSDYKQHVVEKFVMTDTLGAFETRVTTAQLHSEQRLVAAIDEVKGRIDQLIAAQLGAPSRGKKGAVA